MNPSDGKKNNNMEGYYYSPNLEPHCSWSWSGHIAPAFNQWYDNQPFSHWNRHPSRPFTRWDNPNQDRIPNANYQIPQGNLFPVRNPLANNQIQIPQANATPACPSTAKVCVPQKSNDDRPSLRKVKLKQLPFYCEIKRLLATDVYVAPVLLFSREYIFKVDRQLGIFSRQDCEILVRMCPWVANKEHDDSIPHEITIEINGTPLTITNYKSPLVITECCKPVNDHNVIKISSRMGTGNYYLLMITIMKKKTVKDLLDKVKPIGMQDAISFVKKVLLKQDEEISSKVHQCTLTCPLGKTRMKIPCRSEACHHIQCFDAHTYLQMNELYGRWMCPVCHIVALPRSLKRDRLFEKMLETTDESVTKISIERDGTWKPALENAKDEELSVENAKKGTKRILMIDLIDEDDDDELTLGENINIKQENESPGDRNPQAKRAKVETVAQNCKPCKTKTKEQAATVRRSRRHRKRHSRRV